MEQIALFDDLPCGHRVRAKRGPCKKKPTPVGEQFSLLLTQSTELIEEDDDPWVTAPIIKRTVSARDAAPVAIKGPSSVWDMAFAPISMKPMEAGKRKTLKVVQVNGITRVTPIMEHDTDEYKAREIARRARQRPPRPTAAFKTMSAKFKALVD